VAAHARGHVRDAAGPGVRHHKAPLPQRVASLVARGRDRAAAGPAALADGCRAAPTERWQGALWCAHVAVKTGASDVPLAEPLGAWPAAHGERQTWDMGVASAELDALAALWAPPPAALLAPGVAAADAAGLGGALVLYELRLGSRYPAFKFGDDAVAQSHKLGVLLLHADEERAREASCEATRLDAFQRAGDGTMSIADMDAILGPLGNACSDVPSQRAAPARGGARVQLISGARWTRVSWDESASGAGSASGSERGVGEPQLVRFWLREARLKSMVDAGWCVHTVTSDALAMLTEESVPLGSEEGVRRL
jgi:hypothetical protein